jgi:hypothetical protein
VKLEINYSGLQNKKLRIELEMGPIGMKKIS